MNYIIEFIANLVIAFIRIFQKTCSKNDETPEQKPPHHRRRTTSISKTTKEEIVIETKSSSTSESPKIVDKNKVK